MQQKLAFATMQYCNWFIFGLHRVWTTPVLSCRR